MDYKMILCMLLALSCYKSVLNQKLKKLIVLHNNDIHGRFDQINSTGGECTEQDKGQNRCFGGFARIATTIENHRRTLQSEEAILYLYAGDIFDTTIWFTYYKADLASKLMNMLKPDAIALGHTEFDFLPEILSKYLSNLETNILAANIDTSQETKYKFNIKKSVVLTKLDKKIGIIGYISPAIVDLGTIGDLKISEEIAAIQMETQRLKNKENVDYIIAVGHSGFSMDQKIASKVDGLDLVIGGHTHTLLWNENISDKEMAEGPYPLHVMQTSGKLVPVAQASSYTKYFGVLNVSFGSDNITTIGDPTILHYVVEQKKEVKEIIENLKPEINKLFVEIIGRTMANLQGDPKICRTEECNFGNLIADALVTYASNHVTRNKGDTLVGIYHGRGILHPISAGNITKADLLLALPFDNSVVALTLTGSDIFRCMEEMFSMEKRFPQVSGLLVIVDKAKVPYSRVESIDVRRHIGTSFSYESLDLQKDYRIITSSFLADGGDGGTILRKKGRYREILELSDTAIVQWYIERKSMVNPKVEGRIMVFNAGVILLSNFIFVLFILYTYIFYST